MAGEAVMRELLRVQGLERPRSRVAQLLGVRL
jgi:hypothetical protein